MLVHYVFESLEEFLGPGESPYSIYCQRANPDPPPPVADLTLVVTCMACIAKVRGGAFGPVKGLFMKVKIK